MRILKPQGIEIEFDDKKRHLLFNVNVIDEVQEKYDDYIVNILNSLFDKENNYNSRNAYNKLSFILLTLLNEDVRLHNKNNPDDKWEPITEDFINSELLTNDTSASLSILVLQSFNGTLPKSEDEDPNQASGTTKK